MQNPISALIAAALTLPAATSVLAQSTPAPQQTTPSPTVPTLPRIEVAGTDEASFTEIVIDREALQLRQASTMAEVFKGEPSINIGGGARNAQRLYLRGIEASNLNITVDGARQGRNLHQHRGGIGSIDPELLKQVEIRTGPSADAGPGALGGGIRFETVDAQDLLQDGRLAGAIVRTSYSSVDDAIRGGATVYGLAAGHVGLMAHVNAINRNDYRVGGSGSPDKVPNSAGHDRDYMFKLSVLDMAGHSLRLGAARSSNSGLYVYGSTGSDMGYPVTDNAVPQTIQRDTYTLDHRYHQEGNPWVDWQLNLYANRNELENHATAVSNRTNEYGGSARNTLMFTAGALQNRLTVGADYMNEEGRTAQRTGSNTTESRNLGLFMQNRMSYGPVMLSAGLRYDDYRSDYGPYKTSDSELSPNIGAEVDLGRGFSLHGSYGRAVRGSGVIPIGWLNQMDGNANFNDGKPLKPEKSQASEIGLAYQGSGIVTAGDRFHARLSRFETRIENLIEWVGGGMTYPAYVRNMPNALTSKGWELRTGWSLGSYETTIAAVKAEVTSGGQPYGVVRRSGASLGDRLSWTNHWQVTSEITLGYTLEAVRRLNDLPAGSVERPGYVLHGIQAQWRPAAVRGLTLGLVVDNLMDKRYSSHTSISAAGDNILHEPGRDIRLSASYQF